MLPCEASPHRNGAGVGGGRGGMAQGLNWVSNLLHRIKIAASCVTVDVMHVLCHTHLFHMVVRREKDSLCSILTVQSWVC